MVKRLILISFIIVTFSVLCISCSSTPSVSDAKKAVLEKWSKNEAEVDLNKPYLSSEHHPICYATDFIKKNGISVKKDGYDMYEMIGTTKSKFLRDYESFDKKVIIPAGGTGERTTTVIFLKTENGWIVKDIQ